MSVNESNCPMCGSVASPLVLLRTEVNVTREEVAKALGVRWGQTVFWYEAGQHQIPMEKMEAVADVLDCELDEVLAAAHGARMFWMAGHRMDRRIARCDRCEMPLNTLARLRKRARVTQRELAQAVGVCSSSVSLWEKGQNAVPEERIPVIAQALGCHHNEVASAVRVTKWAARKGGA